MSNEQECFLIDLSVCRKHLKSIGYDNADNFSDEIMRKIAEEIAEHYIWGFNNVLTEVMNDAPHLAEGRTKSKITAIYVSPVGEYTCVTFKRSWQSRDIYIEGSVEQVLERFPIPRNEWRVTPAAGIRKYPIYVYQR